MQLNASANNRPTFDGGSSQNRMVCQDVSWNISSWLNVTDVDFFDTQTWFVESAPISGGSLSGFPATATSSGISFFPTGLVYTPLTGFSGPDQFKIGVTDGTDTAWATITLSIMPPPSLALGANPVVCRGTTSATISFTSLTGVGPVTVPFAAVHDMVNWTVPTGITSIGFVALGASGGADNVSTTPNPGNGGRVQGAISVTPGQTLTMVVGSAGSPGSAAPVAFGGYNGGGDAYYYPGVGCGGGGGGASDIRMGGTALSNRIVVAGGGGGNGWDNPHGAYAGGNGGELIAANGEANVGGSHAGGGNQFVGGSAATLSGWPTGGAGSLGMGGVSSLLGGVAGGGGGGYYGGGGGVWTGGGGGSSYTDPAVTSLVTHTQGYNIGDGQIAITYTNEGTYDIVWDAAAISEGFADVTGAPLPTTPFTISVPAGATAGATYNGTITISNGLCTSVAYPISVTVNPVPDVYAVRDTAICHGVASPDYLFSGSIAATMDWTNDNISIGLGASGTGHIPSWIINNPGTLPQVAHLTVTPTVGGCTGNPMTVTITANPIPMLSSAHVAGAICSGARFSYNPASATPGTTFSWVRDTVVGISNPISSGTGNPNEVLVNTTDAPLTVSYIYTLQAAGCPHTDTVTVVVNPTPMLSSALLAGTICNGTLFSYNPASTTRDSSFTWTRNIVTGITNPIDSGAGNPMETLNNISAVPVDVIYTYTTRANGCFNYQDVTVRVNPTPTLTSPRVFPSYCSGTLFSYTPASSTPGVTYQWNRPSVVGIANPAVLASTVPPSEVLVNTTDHPVVVTYEYSVIVGGCFSPTYLVTVTVNPKPTLSSSLTPAGICSGTPFTYTATPTISGTSMDWIRRVVPGISNSTGLGSGNISETLNNTTTVTVVDTYYYSLNLAGCTNTQNVVVPVNPVPMITSSLTPPAICDSSRFDYAPTSSTPGATYNWSRAYVPGILQAANTGTGNPMEMLVNTTNVSVDLAYVFTASANGCTAAPVTIPVRVHPTPRLSSVRYDSVCNGVEWAYLPASYVAGATFAWTRPAVTGIESPTNFGTGGIRETLYNRTSTAKFVDYLFRVTANGCSNITVQHVTLKVNPAPAGSNITSNTPTPLCSNSFYQTFNASTAQPVGQQFVWSAENAQIWSASTNKQYVYVNFYNPGDAKVVLTSIINATGCQRRDSVIVNVTDGVAENPTVIYFQGEFICLQNNMDSYQWGYDDLVTFESFIIEGAFNQSYTSPDANFSTRRYWVLTKHNGCTQKAYYNKPTGVANVNSTVDAGMKIYPSPTSDYVNVEFNTAVKGNIQVDIINMLGQKLRTEPTINHKVKIDVANLPAGCYLVDSYSDGVKIATSRFIKN